MPFQYGGGGGGGAGGTLPSGVNQSWLESQGGSTNVWQPPPNELLTALLTNATSAGDAGSRADHFLGSSLNVAWTAAGTGLATAVGGSVLSISTGANSHYVSVLKTYTPTGDCTVFARIRRGAIASSQIGLLIGDSSFAITGDAFAGNAGIARLVGDANSVTSYDLFTIAAGVGTSTGQTAILGSNGSEWMLCKLSLTHSTNSFSATFSYDGAGFTVAATHAQAFTPAVLGFFAIHPVAGYTAIDFVDVLA